MEKIYTRSEMIHAMTAGEFGVFARRVSRGLPKAQQRAVREILWGMLLSQSVRLSHIGRWISDGVSRVLYRVKRLSRQLGQGDWNTDRVEAQHLSGVAKLVGEETSIVIDTSDIRKDYGKSFQYLDRIRDGSRGETAPGYSFLTVTAVFGGGRQMPLYMAPYSTRKPDYQSENIEVLRAIRTVVGGIGRKGVWVADRGFDNRLIFNEFTRSKLRFLVCVFHDRTVICQGEEQGLLTVGEKIPLAYRMEMSRRKFVGRKGMAKQKFSIRYGAREVVLSEAWDSERREQVSLKLWLIAVEGYDPSGKRALFLTNVPLSQENEITQTLRRYADRWAVEEEIEFLKQRFHLEDVRVRSWKAIERMLLCAMLAFAFLSWYLERLYRKHKKLVPILCSVESDLDPDARFLYYRIHTALSLACGFVQALSLRQQSG